MQYIGLYINAMGMKDKHLTLSYNPTIKYLEKVMPLLGKEYTIKCTHTGVLKGRSGVLNRGYKVELPEELKELFQGVVPHITTYVAPHSKAVRTAECIWSYCEPFEIIGKLTAFDGFNRPEIY